MTARMKKISPPTLVFFALVGLITFFAASFSMQGFLTLGGDLTSGIDTWPLLGWLIKAILIVPNVKVVGFILLAFTGAQCWKSKGVSALHAVLLFIAVLFIGGVETLNNNVGAICGFLLFVWFNAVQLSSWAGLLLGYNKNWAKALKPYIAFAYVGEFVINLIRFTPYDDANIWTFVDDLRYSALDPSLIRLDNLAWMFISIIAVEFTFVFFIKLGNLIQEQQAASPKRGRNRSARAYKNTQAQAYAQRPQGPYTASPSSATGFSAQQRRV